VHPKCAKQFWTIALEIFRFAESAQVRAGPKDKKEGREKMEEKEEENQEDKKKLVERVIPFRETPKAPEDMEWNFREADYNVEQLRRACAWYDAEKPDVKASYKRPHHLAVGRVVWRGVAAAMAALMGARGGVDIPAEDRRGVYNHLAKHYAQFNREPPEFREALKEAEEAQGVREGEKERSKEGEKETVKIEEKLKQLEEKVSELEEKLKQKQKGLAEQLLKQPVEKEAAIPIREILKIVPEKWVIRSWSFGPQRFMQQLEGLIRKYEGGRLE